MKIILLSDVHLLVSNPVCRLDDLVENQWKKVEHILRYAQKENAVILQSGDLTNTPRSWFILSKLTSLFQKYEINKDNFFTIYGQHNQYYRSKEATLLEVLEKNGLVTVLDNEFLYSENNIDVRVYGISWNEENKLIEYKKEIRKSKRNLFNILVIHAPITDKTQNFEFSQAKKFLKKNKQFDIILTGDIHKKYEIWQDDRVILNTGCLLRKTADKESQNHKPCFAVYDTNKKKLEWIEVPHEKDVISREHLDQEEDRVNMLNDFIEAVDSDIELGTNIKENLKIFIKENNIEDSVIEILDKKMQGDKI